MATRQTKKSRQPLGPPASGRATVPGPRGDQGRTTRLFFTSRTPLVAGQVFGLGLLRVGFREAGQGHGAVERVDVDGHAAHGLVFQQLGLDGGRDDLVVDVGSGAFLAARDGAAGTGQGGAGEDGDGDCVSVVHDFLQ